MLGMLIVGCMVLMLKDDMFYFGKFVVVDRE